MEVWYRTGQLNNRNALLETNDQYIRFNTIRALKDWDNEV
jgi:hypothetical protein